MTRRNIALVVALAVLATAPLVAVKLQRLPGEPESPPGTNAATSSEAARETIGTAEDGEAIAKGETAEDTALIDDAMDQIDLTAIYRDNVDWDEWQEEGRRLSATSSQDLLAAAMSLLEIPDDRKRNLAVKSISCWVPDTALHPFYEKLLSDSYGSNRAHAIQSLLSGGMDTPAIIEEVTNIAIGDPSPYARKESAQYFHKLSQRRPELINDTVAQALGEIVLDPSMKDEPWGRLCAALALSRVSVGGEEVVAMLAESYERNRKGRGEYDLAIATASAAALARRGEAGFDVKGYLLDSLESGSKDHVSRACIIGLTNWGDDESVQEAVRRAVLNTPDTIWVGQVYEAAGEFGKATGSEVVAEACLQKFKGYVPHWAREELAVALGQMGRKEGPEWLLESTTEERKSGTPYFKNTLCRKLREATGQDFGYRPYAPSGHEEYIGEPFEKWRRFIEENCR